MRTHFRRLFGAPLLLAGGLFFAPVPASGQTPADSAQVVLDAGRMLEQQGRVQLARELFRHVAERWPGTPAAVEARRRSGALPTESASGLGRTGFIVYHSLYGGFLGVALPAALDADGPEAYGAGLLVGAPLGFLLSRTYANARRLTEGQAGIINFGSYWGTFQGLGWREVLDIGEREVCDIDFCYVESPGTAPWAMAIAGGLTGLAAGVLASHGRVTPSTSNLVFHAAHWGLLYGFAVSVLADLDEDERLAATLIGGNAGLLGAIPAAMAWQPAPSQVRIASAGGVAGGLAGLGVVLLTNTEADKGIMSIVTAGVTAGLIAGTVLGRDREERVRPGEDRGAGALLHYRAGWRLDLPVLEPAAVPLESPSGRRRHVPGIRVKLVDHWF